MQIEILRRQHVVLGLRHVSFNGFFMPVGAAVDQVRRCCVPVHVKTTCAEWPIVNRGSAFLYAIRNRQFCVFTRHQLGQDWGPSEVYIRLTASDRILYSGARFVQFPGTTDTAEEHDLCAVEMPWQRQISGVAPKFFGARPISMVPADGSEKLFALGYPYRLNQMHGEERSEAIGMTQVRVWADGVCRRKGNLPMLKLKLGGVMTTKCDGDFNGFSGGPVFGLSCRTRSLEFRGVVFRGGRDRLFFAPASWVDRLCEIGLAQPRSENAMTTI